MIRNRKATSSRRSALFAGAAASLVLAIGGEAPSRAADAAVTDWPAYNRTYAADRYVTLDQINKSNVANLKQVCVYDLGIDTGFETGPIVIGQTLYGTTATDTFAIDAATCKEK